MDGWDGGFVDLQVVAVVVMDVSETPVKMEAVEDVEIWRMGFCWISLCWDRVVFFCVRRFGSGAENESNVECREEIQRLLRVKKVESTEKRVGEKEEPL